jgi:hypothetical protein
MKYTKYEKPILCRKCGGINTITVDDIKMDNHDNFYITCMGCAYLIHISDYEVPYSKAEKLKSDNDIVGYQQRTNSINCTHYDQNYCRCTEKYGELCTGRECGYYTEKCDVKC